MEITNAQSTPSIPAAPASPTAVTSDFETFLRMLTVQMENQDPLNPVDSADYAVQLATFSGVEQQVQTNDLLRDLATQMGSSSMAQMAAWVGREARVPAAGYFDGSPVALAPNPVSLADRAEVVVTNQAGDEVDRFNVPISAEPLEWAGLDHEGNPYPTGLYSFTISSFSGEELLDESPVDVYSMVTEVRSQDGEAILILSGGAAIAASQVNALRDPSLIADSVPE